MPEGGGENKENHINHELSNESDLWIKEKEKERKEREKRIEKSFSKIDKLLGNFKDKNMSNPEKESKSQGEKLVENVPEFKNWLINEKDFKDIKNEELKTFVEFTGGIDSRYLTVSAVLNSIDKLHGSVSSGKIKKFEADKLIPKFHEQLRNLTARDQKKKIDSEERFVESMTESQRKAKTEQINLELPQFSPEDSLSNRESQIEKQRLYIRKFLDNIENSNRDSHDFAISYIVNALEGSLEEMAPSVRNEVEARLSLHDCSELILQANGWLQRDQEKVGYGFTIGSAAAKAKEWHHDLTRKKIEILFRNSMDGGLPGLKIPEAWDKMQEAVFNYDRYVSLALNDRLLVLARDLKENKSRNFSNEEINKAINWIRKNKAFSFKRLDENQKKQVEKMRLKENDFSQFFNLKGLEKFDDELGQKIPSNFYTDSEGIRKEAVRRHIISELGGDKNAEKSLQLAEKMAIATLETSIFNDASTGNDHLSEIVYLEDWRKGRTEKGRNRGPEIHENLIPGFGQSWLRYISEDKTRNLEKTERVLNSEEVIKNIDKIKEGSYSYYTALVLTRYSLLKGYLMNRTLEPLKIDKNALQGLIVLFLNADKPVLTNEEKERFGGGKSEAAKKYLKQRRDGPLKLRTLWLLGIVDSALSNEALNWDSMAFRELRKAVTMEILSKEAGTFISPKQWQWIERKTGLSGRLALLTLYRASRDSFSSFSKGGKR